MYILSTENIPTQLEILTMILYFLFMFVPSVFCELFTTKRYFENTDFADYLYTGSFLSEIINLSTRLSCAMMCLYTTNCAGFFNHNDKSECKLMLVKVKDLSETQVSSGWKYFTDRLGKYHYNNALKYTLEKIGGIIKNG